LGTPATGDASNLAVRKGLVYTTRDGQALRGDLHTPAGEGPFPVVIAAPGGGWAVCDPSGLKHWGEFLARHGFATFAFQYRVSAAEKTFPKPVFDVLDAIRFVRRSAAELRVDPERIALLGSSAGAHVSALAALAGDAPPFAGSGPADVDARVKAFAGIYGAYDMFALWQQEIANAPSAAQRRSECSLGGPPYADRQLYFDASPLSHVRYAVNKLPVFLAWGTADQVVPPQTQSLPFLAALKQAGFMVQGCPVAGAGHFWFMDEPVEEPGSFSAFLAPRLLRFLQRHL
jgi:acetyl esterase/lipase